MAIQTFTSGQILTAADTNTYLANSGLVAVAPTSVTNGSTTSGTASATVSAAQSTVTLVGVFSSTFDSYRVVISNLTMSSTAASTVMYVKMSDGTTAASTNYNYGFARIDPAVGSVTGTGAALGTAGMIIGVGTGDKFGTSFDVVNPNIATHTIFPQLSISVVSTANFGIGVGLHQTSTAFTSLQILPSTGTMTGGVITVYGYRK